ncbi:response regulator, partial [Candidatus Riflebacteria bacterium]
TDSFTKISPWCSFMMLYAPLNPSPLPASKPLVEKKEKKKEAIYKHEGSARVLWVDDDNTLRKTARHLIRALGHTGDVAGSGQEALEYLDSNEYDLVLTDLGMPGMNGWQLADIINKKFKGKMKVAVVTGWGAQVSEEKKKEHGVGYVLGKPVEIKQIENLISEAMQLKQR